MKDLIKANGLIVKTVTGEFLNKFTGRSNGKAQGLFDQEGRIFCIKGEPYFPLGGRKAFISVVEQGCLNLSDFTFEPFNNLNEK